MTIDAAFWVSVSFVIFIGALIYFKIPSKVIDTLNETINSIKNQVDNAEKLKDESKNILSDYEKKLSNAKAEIKSMIDQATEDADKHVLKTNEEFHNQIENRKKNTEERIKQMKNQAIKDIKNTSVNIAIQSVEALLKNSLDKNKLNKVFENSIQETKTALKTKSS
jgi:F-type H+-transporting ATPase subunit b